MTEASSSHARWVGAPDARPSSPPLPEEDCGVDHASEEEAWRCESEFLSDSDCRPNCAARRNPNAECVCAEVEEMEAR